MAKREKRNLTKRGGTWYVEGVFNGVRVKRSLKTGSLEVARERRDVIVREAGHENEAVAAAHYDRLDFTTYREPERLQPGETPMDLFARLCVAPERGESHTTRHTTSPSARRNPPKRKAAGWRSQRESKTSASAVNAN